MPYQATVTGRAVFVDVLLFIQIKSNQVEIFLDITGYARLSNVEFINTGQEGFTESYDARFSVAYIAVGTVSDVKPSVVTGCSFHKGFNSAVGAFGIGGLNIDDNVVYGTVGSGESDSEFNY